MLKLIVGLWTLSCVMKCAIPRSIVSMWDSFSWVSKLAHYFVNHIQNKERPKFLHDNYLVGFVLFCFRVRPFHNNYRHGEGSKR